jgi:hypothetical protein
MRFFHIFGRVTGCEQQKKKKNKKQKFKTTLPTAQQKKI